MSATIIVILIAAAIGVIWLMRIVPSVSNAILAFVGLATFIGVFVSIASYEPALLDPLLSNAPAPDVADLSFNVTYRAVDGGLPENQKWWTIGNSPWVLTGLVVNNSDNELTKLKFEVFIKSGASIIGDEAVATQHSWKVSPRQNLAFTTSSNTFKYFPTMKSNPIWGLKLVEINNTPVKTDIVWSTDNPFSQVGDSDMRPASKRVKTLEVIPK
jgi:hypothetical protein